MGKDLTLERNPRCFTGAYIVKLLHNTMNFSAILKIRDPIVHLHTMVVLRIIRLLLPATLQFVSLQHDINFDKIYNQKA